VTSLEPQKTFGCARTRSKSRYGTRLEELDPPIVVMIPRTSGFANRALISSARSRGVSARALRGRTGGEFALDHAEPESGELRDAVEVLGAERHVRGERRRADADRVAGAERGWSRQGSHPP